LLILADTNAQIYAEFRPRYPEVLIDDLRSRTIGERGELMIDWGCGTGELTLPLSPYFDRVIAIDLGPDRIPIAEDEAQRKGLRNIEWHVGKAEDLEIAPESCDLITCASAFHWMDRELLSERAFKGLRQGGAVALTGGAGGDIWQGSKDWHKIAIECLMKYLPQPPSEEKRTGRPKGAAPAKKWHADFLIDAGFQVENLQYPTEFSWPVDQVAGYMYSITGGLPWSLGDNRAAFEQDFSEALTRLDPSGVVRETIDFFLLIAHKSLAV
jgi:SAM-dependent methyltransferase